MKWVNLNIFQLFVVSSMESPVFLVYVIVIKELKRRNKDDGHDDKYDLREQLEEVTRNLKERDTEIKVTIDLFDINNSPAQYYRAYCTARMS